MQQANTCVSTIRCVGTLSELNIEIYRKNDSVVLKGGVVLHTNSDYVKFNIIATKSFNQLYYKILNTIGIPYSFISNIDETPYKVERILARLSTHGRIKLIENDEIIDEIELRKSNNPIKLFVIANMDEYGYKLSYMERSRKEDYLETNVKLIPYKYNNDYIYGAIVGYNQNINIIKLKYDIPLNNIKGGYLYDTLIRYENGIEMEDDLILNVKSNGFKIIDMKQLDKAYDYQELQTMIEINELNKQIN